jgi:predicted metal-dependent hydrolase
MVDARTEEHFYSALHKGIEEFNLGRYFEAHDVLEDLWMETVGEDRLFLQGLIQVSVGFYHLFNRNFVGAVSQFKKGLSKLENYLPHHRRVELDQFSEEVKSWKTIAERGLNGEEVVLEPGKAPRLELTEG